MADGTKIEWTDATWNPITGCSVVSPGCTNCYAMKLAGTRLRNHPSRAGLTVETKAGPVWTGEVRFNDKALTDPLRWTRPRMIFVVAHGDLFAEQVPDEWIDRIFAVMALCPQHIFQVLTKRPARMLSYVSAIANNRVRFSQWAASGADLSREAGRSREAPPRWPLPNVWLGVSVEDQKRAEERIPLLLRAPAAIRWISAEPLLGPIDVDCPNVDWMQYPEGNGIVGKRLKIDWVVAGGESGPGARPSHPDWFRSLRDQCAEAGVPFLFKQWGNWAPDDGPLSEHRDPIMDGAAQCAIYGQDGWQFFDNGFQPPIDSGIGQWVYRIGKKDAGRHLDGVLHDGLPRIERSIR